MGRQVLLLLSPPFAYLTRKAGTPFPISIHPSFPNPFILSNSILLQVPISIPKKQKTSSAEVPTYRRPRRCIHVIKTSTCMKTQVLIEDFEDFLNLLINADEVDC
jgi:hypothetical protein